MGSIVTYLKEVRVEMGKVIWPKLSDVVKLTITVLVITLMVGAYLGGLDFGFAKLLELLVV